MVIPVSNVGARHGVPSAQHTVPLQYRDSHAPYEKRPAPMKSGGSEWLPLLTLGISRFNSFSPTPLKNGVQSPFLLPWIPAGVYPVPESGPVWDSFFTNRESPELIT